MKKNGHKLLTLAALLGTATGVIHITNRFIDATSQLKDMLEQPHSRTYDWRFGKIFYTKQGHGTPILLIHDIMPGASGYEWNAIDQLVYLMIQSAYLYVTGHLQIRHLAVGRGMAAGGQQEVAFQERVTALQDLKCFTHCTSPSLFVPCVVFYGIVPRFWSKRKFIHLLFC